MEGTVDWAPAFPEGRGVGTRHANYSEQYRKEEEGLGVREVFLEEAFGDVSQPEL